MSQLFVSGGQSFGVFASLSVVPMNIQAHVVWCFHESHSYLPGDFPEAKSSWDFFSVTPPHPNALSLDKVNSSQ